MKKIVAATLFAVSTFAVPAAFVATPVSAATCGVDAPPEWERPGGFCDALKSTGSLTTPVEGTKEVECETYESGALLLLLRDLQIGDRIHVAAGVVCPD